MSKLKFNPITNKLDFDSADLVSAAVDTVSNTLSAEIVNRVSADNALSNSISSVAYFKGVLGVAPVAPQEGWLYINSGDNKMYVYYGGSWQELHVLVPAAAEFLLLETGDAILLENGDKIVLEA